MIHSPLPPFSAWAGPRNPKILFIGEAFGEGEDLTRQPFSGESGKEFWRMLGEANPDCAPELHAWVTAKHKFGLAWIRDRHFWMAEAGIAFTNVVNLRPPGNKIPELCVQKKELPNDYDHSPIQKGLYLRPEYLPELSRLQFEIETSKPNLIVCLGNTACWALLRSTNISAIRGTTTTASGVGREDFTGRMEVKCLPTYHPAGVLYNWGWRPIVLADLMKAFREGEFPEIRRPERNIIVNPTLQETCSWIHETIKNPPPFLGCDTETSLGMIDTIGFARSKDDALVIPFGPHRRRRGNNYLTTWPIRNGERVISYWEEWEERIAWKLVKYILDSPIPKVFQNGMYDLQYLMRMGIFPNMDNSEDTMLLSHSLFPEMPKGLGFLGSIYTSEASWKLMRTNPSDTEKRDE